MNNHYQLYVESVLTLAETIVIKFDDAASALNYTVTNVYGASGVNMYDKRSWKYYQNISGQYHFTDQMIRVVSLDTAELIDFTRENLEIHLATREAYAFGTRHYKELVQNHPGMDLLILGILNPTPIDVAIAAKDGEILRWPSRLVESNEVDLIPRLQHWIYQYLERWVNHQYTISDDLYVPSYMAQLYLHLVPAIICFRKDACKTPQAHSFHVRQYLASHAGLDVYLDKMNQYQALWFYRNILYIQRHAGKRDTFDWLVENVMSQRHLPLYEYTMVHNAAAMGRDTIEDDRLLPEIEFRRTGVNSYANAVDITKYTLDGVIQKVNPLALGNPQYNLDNEEAMRNDFAYGKSSVVNTKMLESSVTDYSDAAVYTLADILLNHWLGLVGKGRYLANVVIQLPASSETIQLAAQDAVALYIYAMHKTMQAPVGSPDYAPLIYVPKYQVHRLTRTVKPPLSQLRSIASKKALSDAALQEILATSPAVPVIVSIEAFYNFGLKVAEASALQYAIYSSKEDYLARGDAQMVTSRLYDDDICTLNSLQDPNHPGRGIPYLQLFQGLGIDLDNYTDRDFYNLAIEIVGKATGAAEKPTNNLGELQRAMVALFAKLSSYSIQVITEINASNLVVVPFPAIRVGAEDMFQQEQAHHYIDGAPIQVLDLDEAESTIHQVPVAEVTNAIDNRLSQHFIAHEADFSSTVRVKEDFTPRVPYHMEVGGHFVGHWDLHDLLTNLTEDQRANLVDEYTDWRERVVETLARQLNGFQLRSEEQDIGSFEFASREVELPAFALRHDSRTLAGLQFFVISRELSVFAPIVPPP